MSNPTDPQDPYGQSGGSQPEPGQQPPAYGGPAYGQPGMGDGYTAPPPPPGYYGGGVGGPAFPSTEKNSLGVWALVLGILGLVCCGLFTGIPAIILGGKAKEAAAQGLANNGGLGTAGVVMGWISVAFSALGIVYFLFMGGMAALSESGAF